MDGAGRGGAQVGAGGHRSLRDSRGGSSGAGGIIKDSGGMVHSKSGAAKRKTSETKMIGAWERGRWNETGGSQVSSDGSGKKCHAEGTNKEDSAEKSAKWSGEEKEGLETEEVSDGGGG